MGKEAIRFGTDGWRGIMCEDFTVDNIELVAQAIAEYVKSTHGEGSSLVVGHDTRFFAEEFAAACSRVLAGNGLRVLLPSGALPTPLVAFAIGNYEAHGAIMLTASHNPAVYNGIKFIPQYGGPASPEITGKIEATLSRLDFAQIRRKSAIEAAECEPICDYVDHLHSLVDFDALRSASLSVALDVMYGAARGIMAPLLREAGCNVESIHESRDAFFGGRVPEPAEGNLDELAHLVRKGGFDLGLALDGDADRFGVTDSDGRLLTSNQVLSVLALHLLRRRRMRGRIVRTVATTHLLDAIASANGIECVETPVGFKYVAAEMLDGDVLIGGEESGGLSIAGHMPEKDGLLADLLMCEVTAMSGQPLSKVLDQVYEEFGRRITRRIDVHYPAEAKNDLLSRLTERAPSHVGGLEVKGVKTIDGVKYLLEREAWVLVRPSGTEPVVRAYIEAGSEGDFAVIEEWTKKQLETSA